jgi:hypothetical protein
MLDLSIGDLALIEAVSDDNGVYRSQYWPLR